MLPFLGILACGSPVELDDTGGTTAGTDACESSSGAGVPAFFSTYFRCVTATADGGTVTLASNGLPPHPSPYWPTDDPLWVEFDTRDGERMQNPNTIARQALSITFSEAPVPLGATITAATVDGEAGGTGEFRCEAQGMSLDGTALFAGYAAPGDSLAQEELTFDQYEGHPQDRGVYHHHGSNPAALEILAEIGLATEVYGVMCDGTVVLGCTELDGSAPGTLDAQNGHVHDLDDGGGVLLAERYHVHACEALGRHYTPEIQYYEIP